MAFQPRTDHPSCVDDVRWQTVQDNLQQLSEEHRIVIRELGELQQLHNRSTTPVSRMLCSGSRSVPTEDSSQPTMNPESRQLAANYVFNHLHDLEKQEAVYKSVEQHRGSQCPGLQECKDSLEVAKERIEQYLKRLENLHLQGANQDDHREESARTTLFGDWSKSDQIPTQSSTHCKHSKQVDSAVDAAPLSPRTSKSKRSSHADTIDSRSFIETSIESIADFKTVGQATLYAHLSAWTYKELIIEKILQPTK
jgi:hypothetical protein